MSISKKITIKEFAKKIGVSTTAISRALNGHKNISKKTTKKIIKAAKKYKYFPDASAKRLASKKPDTIAFITSIDPYAQDYVLMEFLAGLTIGVKNKSTELIVKFLSNEKAELPYYKKLIELNIADKFIFYRTKKNDQRIKFLQKNNINFVTWGRSSGYTDYAWMDLDNEKSIYILMKRLFDFGHRKIGFINVDQSFNYGFQRKNTYEKFHTKFNIPYSSSYYQESLDSRTTTGIKLTKKILSLKNPPTAIICSLDKYFIGCLQECQNRRLELGKDITVVGFNDHDNYLSTQDLTYISHPLNKMGRMAIKILSNLENGATPSKQSMLIDPVLHEGPFDKLLR